MGVKKRQIFAYLLKICVNFAEITIHSDEIFIYNTRLQPSQ